MDVVPSTTQHKRPWVKKYLPFVLGVSLSFKVLGFGNLFLGKHLSATFQVPYLAIGRAYDEQTHQDVFTLQLNRAPTLELTQKPSGLEIVCRDADMVHSQIYWSLTQEHTARVFTSPFPKETTEPTHHIPFLFLDLQPGIYTFHLRYVDGKKFLESTNVTFSVR